MSDLLVLVPTRGRPFNAWRIGRAFERTCTAGTELRLLVDDDDPAADAYRKVPNVKVVMCGEWRPMVHKLNRAAQSALAAGETPAVFGFMGDDHLPRTPGWDATILAELAGMGTGIVYGNDLLQGEKLPTAWFTTADIVRSIGAMVPADVGHMYCDNAVKDLGEAAGCLRYLPDVVIEHLHPLAGKAAWDDGYVKVNSEQQYKADEAVYRAWRDNWLKDDAAAVNALRGSSCR